VHAARGQPRLRQPPRRADHPRTAQRQGPAVRPAPSLPDLGHQPGLRPRVAVRPLLIHAIAAAPTPSTAGRTAPSRRGTSCCPGWPAPRHHTSHQLRMVPPLTHSLCLCYSPGTGQCLPLRSAAFADTRMCVKSAPHPPQQHQLLPTPNKRRPARTQLLSRAHCTQQARRRDAGTLPAPALHPICYTKLDATHTLASACCYSPPEILKATLAPPHVPPSMLASSSPPCGLPTSRHGKPCKSYIALLPESSRLPEHRIMPMTALAASGSNIC
jgi:hypothetical protein